jgi:hypothetical protein
MTPKKGITVKEGIKKMKSEENNGNPINKKHFGDFKKFRVKGGKNQGGEEEEGEEEGVND